MGAKQQKASRCSVCGVSSESSDHLFIRCRIAIALWEAVFSAFQQCISADTWSLLFSQAMSVSFSDHVRVLWKTTIHVVAWSVWLACNRLIFESKTMDLRSALSLVWRAMSDANRLEIECMRNCVDDLLILRRFDLHGCPARAPVIRSVIWSPPAPGWTKVNTDGVALSSPASIAINFAWQNGWHRIWLESDSSYVVQLLSSHSKQVPWRIRQAWQRCIYQISKMEFQVFHIFRDENQVADVLSKHALGLEVDSWGKLPVFLLFVG
ncbi:hypothetical protein Ddye_019989 [Dipteronia dyeriana]|uniref:RNase H type-1 domain-containing protein n=1 Tax=Dipteronia dyeriana TaxID=168575 RepID=A0AAD9TZW1_9ROSI|nr:hypothetical protein Ddye_019989 [Dipteronia dyeriana]